MKSLYLTFIAILVSFACFATTPGPITGTFVICASSTTTLNDATPGGTWSSSAVTVATVGLATGVVTGNVAGTSTITYTIAGGGYVTQVVTVNPGPAAITGYDAICTGYSTSLTDAVSGGTWSSSNVAVGSVGSSSGVVLGISAGITDITYTLAATGCFASVAVTVNTSAGSISGSSLICSGSAVTYSDAAGGGVWSVSAPAIATISGAGVATGIAPGTTTISYTLGAGCTATLLVTVSPLPPVMTINPNPVCTGNTAALSDAATGGAWSSSNPAVGSINFLGGITGVSAGTTTITYTLSTGCVTLSVLTVNPGPAAITGPNQVCTGSATTLMDATAGGTWSNAAPGTLTVGIATGVVSGIAAGSDNVTYSLATGCYAIYPVTVNATPTITATATPNCGGTYSLNASGAGTGGTYVWASAAGLSCSTCAAPTATIAATTMYTVTGTTTAACSGTDTVTLNGDRISGFITMTTTPTDTVKVWLIQFNPADSSLTAEDSILTCQDSGTPYYEFDSKPSGSYLVKGKLLSSVPGTSGYVPTYGLSNAHWDTAMTIVHAGATDTQHINMIYGTVPSGPGFIGGLISAGAGRGTSGVVPAVGMLVYLEDASGNILTYTYTNSTGNYSFSGLGYGTYMVYPVDYHYHTTPWVAITLTSSSYTYTGIGFYEHLTHGTITPTGTTTVKGQAVNVTQLSIYPNPATNMLNINWANEKTGNATVSITDVTGREVYRSALNINTESGDTQLDIHSLDNGIYFIAIRSATIDYTNKILVKR